MHYPHRVETRGPTLEQAQLMIGKPPGVADQSTHQVVMAGDPEASATPGLSDRAKNLLAERLGHPLVGVDKQHPLTRGQIQGCVPLGSEVVECALFHPRTAGASYFTGTVKCGPVHQD